MSTFFMLTNFSLTQAEIQTLANLGLDPNSNNLKQEIIQKIAELETKNPPVAETSRSPESTKLPNLQNGKQGLSSTYFETISPAVWNYKIGGYQVLDKYLKARKDRVLSHQEIEHFKNVVKVIEWTLGVVQNKLR